MAEAMTESSWEGFVERISREGVSGWVLRVGSELPVVVDILHANTVLGTIAADMLRPDLAEAGKGQGRHGFAFKFGNNVPAYSEASPIQVRVRDANHVLPMLKEGIQFLNHTQSPTGAKGFVDRLSRRIVTGWAWIPGTDERLEIEAVVDNLVVASTIADALRADLVAARIGDGKHAFQLRLPALVPAPESVVIRVKGGPTLKSRQPAALDRAPATDHPGKPASGGDGAPANEPSGAAASKADAVEGYIERLTAYEVIGWAWKPPGDERIELEILVDNKVVARARADLERLELADAGIGDGRHGFHVLLDGTMAGRGVPVVRPIGYPPLPRLRANVASENETANVLQVIPQSAKASGESKTSVAAGTGAVARVPDGGIYKIVGGRLLGWARLEEGRTTVLIVVDGKVVGEAQATGIAEPSAGGVPEIIAHGFALEMPPSVLNGAERRVVLYDAQSGARIASKIETLRFSAEPTLASVPAPPPAAKKGMKVAVVAWDMAHNPVGRAFLLADMAARGHSVELIGPIFKFYGGQIWPPIADTSLPIRGFPATDLRSLVAGALELAQGITCDVVHVGKPRLPSLLIGALIRQANNCPMIVDIDDHELAFTKNNTPASFEELTQACRDDPKEIDTAHSDLWTRFAESLLEEADGITVSNAALRRRFGGMMVRHARDERMFDPAHCDRGKVRAEFKYSNADRVILFLGTPRPHKGVFAIADALERLGDDRLALCIVGSFTDKRMLHRFSSYKRARIALHPDQSLRRLPEIVNMADGVACLQDPAHPISQFQLPAKLTDALALGVPVLATPVPPLVDLALADVFVIVENDSQLDAALKRLAESPTRQPVPNQGRDFFLSELSYAVNAARLDLAFAAAATNRVASLPRFEAVFRLLEQQTGFILPRLIDTPPRRERRGPLIKGASPRDLVFLWKQNDSDVYGRRSDMLAKYLLRSGRVRRVLHFDAPLSAADLERQAAESGGEIAHQGNRVYINTVRRILQAADSPNFIKRTFLHRSGGKPERAFGRDLPLRDAYPDFVRDVLREAGVTEAPILWVCPIVFDFRAIADAVRPRFVIADIIDDQRTFPGSRVEHLRRVTAEYETILREADAVFCNCEPLREAFDRLRSDIHVVPNGAELFPEVESWTAPEDLAGLPRPIIGYVGNLRDRVDFSLLEATAKRFPTATIALVGSAHGRPEVPAMVARCSNMRLMGVRPYEEAQRMIRGFDVAIMPHLKNEQSDCMNPLKLYVYFSLGVPIVSTAVANIGDISAYVNVAEGTESFLEAIAAVLAGRGRTVDRSVRSRILKSLSWETRVAEIWRWLELEPQGHARTATPVDLSSPVQHHDVPSAGPRSGSHRAKSSPIETGFLEPHYVNQK